MITGNRIAPLAERDRVVRDIAFYEAILAEHPESHRHRVALEDERAHLARVETTLRCCGWEGP